MHSPCIVAALRATHQLLLGAENVDQFSLCHQSTTISRSHGHICIARIPFLRRPLGVISILAHQHEGESLHCDPKTTDIDILLSLLRTLSRSRLRILLLSARIWRRLEGLGRAGRKWLKTHLNHRTELEFARFWRGRFVRPPVADAPLRWFRSCELPKLVL